MKKKTSAKTKKKAQAESRRNGNDVSRREFLKKTAIGAGVAATALGTAKSALADEALASSVKRQIRIPDEITETLKADPRPASFEGRGMTGGEVFAKFLKAEGVQALFCAPGNYGIINPIADEGIPCYGGRTEGSMCAAADAFIRVTGEIAATSGTEGPGFTNMIMNIGAANAARTPLLILASNRSVGGDDTEQGIQRAYQQLTTEGLRKYGKRLITPKRVYEYAAYAFRALKTGVPGPVNLDFPGEITRPRYTDPGELSHYHDKSKYRTESKPAPSPKELKMAVDMINKAERPMIIASTGVFYHKAWDALKVLAEKADIAVVESGPTRGHFSDGHRLSISTGPDALTSADLVIFVGQYSMPNVGEFSLNPDAKLIRIDPDPQDIGRNMPIDLGIVSDEKEALEALAEAVPSKRREAWVAEMAAARKAFEEQNEEYYQLGLKHSASTDLIHPAVMAKQLSDFLYRMDLPKEQTTVASGGYGIGRYMRRYLRAYRPGQICNGAYQYGAIGPDVGYTFGVGAAVQQGVGPQAPYKGAPVFGITGDAGIAYSVMEFETLSKYRIPAIMIVYNNNAWGVWGSGRRSAKAMHMYLFQENVRYDKVAEGLGARGEYVTSPAEFLPAVKRSYEIAAAEGISTLINCQAKKEFWGNAYPPGMLQAKGPGCMSYSH